MKWILTTDYMPTKVKNTMVNMWDPKSSKERDWYMYLHPEWHSWFRCIHKSNVLLEASTKMELVKLIKANKKICKACLKAWNKKED